MWKCALIAALFVLGSSAVFAQVDATIPTNRTNAGQAEQREANAANAETERSVEDPIEGVPARDPARAAERKKKALAGLAALCGIAITGVAVIAATIVWARRLRRLARDLGPVQKTAGNDFWFLKPPKQIDAKPDGGIGSSPDSSTKRDSLE